MEYLGPLLIAALGFLVVALRRRGGSCAVDAGDDRSLARRLLPFCLPPLITGGPMFIALPTALCSLENPGAPGELYYLALAGGVGLMLGLVIMFGILMRQERELISLRGLVAGKGSVESNLSSPSPVDRA